MPLKAIPKIPEGLIPLMKDLAKEVIKEQPDNIHLFAAEYFERLVIERDGSLHKDYPKFHEYEENYKKKHGIVSETESAELEVTGVAIKAIRRGSKDEKTHKMRSESFRKESASFSKSMGSSSIERKNSSEEISHEKSITIEQTDNINDERTGVDKARAINLAKHAVSLNPIKEEQCEGKINVKKVNESEQSAEEPSNTMENDVKTDIETNNKTHSLNVIADKKMERAKTPESDSGLSEKSFNLKVQESGELSTGEIDSSCIAKEETVQKEMMKSVGRSSEEKQPEVEQFEQKEVHVEKANAKQNSDERIDLNTIEGQVQNTNDDVKQSDKEDSNNEYEEETDEVKSDDQTDHENCFDSETGEENVCPNKSKSVIVTQNSKNKTNEDSIHPQTSQENNENKSQNETKSSSHHVSWASGVDSIAKDVAAKDENMKEKIIEDAFNDDNNETTKVQKPKTIVKKETKRSQSVSEMKKPPPKLAKAVSIGTMKTSAVISPMSLTNQSEKNDSPKETVSTSNDVNKKTSSDVVLKRLPTQQSVESNEVILDKNVSEQLNDVRKEENLTQNTIDERNETNDKDANQLTKNSLNDENLARKKSIEGQGIDIVPAAAQVETILQQANKSFEIITQNQNRNSLIETLEANDSKINSSDEKIDDNFNENSLNEMEKHENTASAAVSADIKKDSQFHVQNNKSKITKDNDKGNKIDSEAFNNTNSDQTEVIKDGKEEQEKVSSVNIDKKSSQIFEERSASDLKVKQEMEEDSGKKTDLIDTENQSTEINILNNSIKSKNSEDEIPAKEISNPKTKTTVTESKPILEENVEPQAQSDEVLIQTKNSDVDNADTSENVKIDESDLEKQNLNNNSKGNFETNSISADNLPKSEVKNESVMMKDSTEIEQVDEISKLDKSVDLNNSADDTEAKSSEAQNTSGEERIEEHEESKTQSITNDLNEDSISKVKSKNIPESKTENDSVSQRKTIQSKPDKTSTVDSKIEMNDVNVNQLEKTNISDEKNSKNNIREDARPEHVPRSDVSEKSGDSKNEELKIKTSIQSLNVSLENDALPLKNDISANLDEKETSLEEISTEKEDIIDSNKPNVIENVRTDNLHDKIVSDKYVKNAVKIESEYLEEVSNEIAEPSSGNASKQRPVLDDNKSKTENKMTQNSSIEKQNESEELQTEIEPFDKKDETAKQESTILDSKISNSNAIVAKIPSAQEKEPITKALKKIPSTEIELTKNPKNLKAKAHSTERNYENTTKKRDDSLSRIKAKSTKNAISLDMKNNASSESDVDKDQVKKENKTIKSHPIKANSDPVDTVNMSTKPTTITKSSSTDMRSKIPLKKKSSAANYSSDSDQEHKKKIDKTKPNMKSIKSSSIGSSLKVEQNDKLKSDIKVVKAINTVEVEKMKKSKEKSSDQTQQSENVLDENNLTETETKKVDLKSQDSLANLNESNDKRKNHKRIQEDKENETALDVDESIEKLHQKAIEFKPSSETLNESGNKKDAKDSTYDKNDPKPKEEEQKSGSNTEEHATNKHLTEPESLLVVEQSINDEVKKQFHSDKDANLSNSNAPQPSEDISTESSNKINVSENDKNEDANKSPKNSADGDSVNRIVETELRNTKEQKPENNSNPNKIHLKNAKTLSMKSNKNVSSNESTKSNQSKKNSSSKSDSSKSKVMSNESETDDDSNLKTDRSSNIKKKTQLSKVGKQKSNENSKNNESKTIEDAKKLKRTTRSADTDSQDDGESKEKSKIQKQISNAAKNIKAPVVGLIEKVVKLDTQNKSVDNNENENKIDENVVTNQSKSVETDKKFVSDDNDEETREDEIQKSQSHEQSTINKPGEKNELKGRKSPLSNEHTQNENEKKQENKKTSKKELSGTQMIDNAQFLVEEQENEKMVLKTASTENVEESKNTDATKDSQHPLIDENDTKTLNKNKDFSNKTDENQNQSIPSPRPQETENAVDEKLSVSSDMETSSMGNEITAVENIDYIRQDEISDSSIEQNTVEVDTENITNADNFQPDSLDVAEEPDRSIDADSLLDSRSLDSFETKTGSANGRESHSTSTDTVITVINVDELKETTGSAKNTISKEKPILARLEGLGDMVKDKHSYRTINEQMKNELIALDAEGADTSIQMYNIMEVDSPSTPITPKPPTKTFSNSFPDAINEENGDKKQNQNSESNVGEDSENESKANDDIVEKKESMADGNDKSTQEIQSSDLSDTETTEKAIMFNETDIDETSRDERDEVSEVENFDFSSCGEDSLEAMYYRIRQEEILSDKNKVKSPNVDEMISGNVNENDDRINFPEKATENLENAFREVSGKKTLRSNGSMTSSVDEIVVRELTSTAQTDDSTDLDRASPTGNEEGEGEDYFPGDTKRDEFRSTMISSVVSETDSDYFEPTAVSQRRLTKDDFNISTAYQHMIQADSMSDEESSLDAAATKIQAGARGFLTRRRLRNMQRDTSDGFDSIKASKSSNNYASIDNSIGDSVEKTEMFRSDSENISKDQSIDQQEQSTENEYFTRIIVHEESTSENGATEERTIENESDVTIDQTTERRLTLQRSDAVQRSSTREEAESDSFIPKQEIICHHSKKTEYSKSFFFVCSTKTKKAIYHSMFNIKIQNRFSIIFLFSSCDSFQKSSSFSRTTSEVNARSNGNGIDSTVATT